MTTRKREALRREHPTIGPGAKKIRALIGLLGVRQVHADDFEIDLVLMFSPCEPAGSQFISFDGDILSVYERCIAPKQVDSDRDDFVVRERLFVSSSPH